MFTRISRYISHLKTTNHKRDRQSEFSPGLVTYLDFEERPSICSSKNSSCCSMQPDPGSAPTFIQVVCNDSQPVYCMDTVPLIREDPKPGGLKRTNSLYESAHDEILRERRKVSEAEGGRNKAQEEVHREPIQRKQSVESLKWAGRMDQKQALPPPITQDRPWSNWSNVREWESQHYTSTDPYYEPLIRPDMFPAIPPMLPPAQRYTYDNRSERSFTPQATFIPPERPPSRTGPSRYRAVPYHPAYLLPGSYCQPTAPILTPTPPYFPPKSHLRQGPYPQPQSQPPISLELTDAPPQIPTVSTEDEIPTTRMTRLKEPPRTFFKDAESVSDVGIGLGRISGMAASRGVSLGIRRTKSDIGLNTHPPTEAKKEKEPETNIVISNKSTNSRYLTLKLNLATSKTKKTFHQAKR
jgi:hypothetical protein